MLPAISIKNLTKHYRKVCALDQISFDVRQGEFFGYLGPNGAGKTTTIRAIAGLVNFQSGGVTVFGHDVIRDYRRARRQIGLVPQEFNFDPFLSAGKILTFEGGYFGMAAREAKQRARELLEFFGLWHKRNDDCKKLSGGMKRRLLIARALMHKPRILILDEPTAGVDLELRHQLWDFLRKINREGVTIVLTTHYIEEAERLCSRIGVIHRGRIVAMDPTGELIRRMSADQVELFLKRPIPGVPEEIMEVPIVIEEDHQKLRFEEKNDAVAKVLRALHCRGIEVERIDLRRPTLEDAFLKLTGKQEKSDSEIRP